MAAVKKTGPKLETVVENKKPKMAAVIRDVWTKLGESASNRDVEAKVVEAGFQMNDSLKSAVSATKRKIFNKPTRSSNKTQPETPQGVELSDLKMFVDEVKGIESAQRVLGLIQQLGCDVSSLVVALDKYAKLVVAAESPDKLQKFLEVLGKTVL